VLFDQAIAPCEANQERREKFSDRASVDDQPLIAAFIATPKVDRTNFALSTRLVIG
jgi:hypothetical protein